ncbi:MAG: anaerobic ribonucleoside-triphosphate reductase [Candidatus Bathyarchaeia archaeon]
MSKVPEKISSAIFDAASSVTRMQILRLLATKGPLSYIEIMLNVKLDPIRDAGKFVYHLRSVVEPGLVRMDKESKKYIITDLGKMVVDFAMNIEEYIAVKRGKLFVRTSRLAIEEFDRSKIVKSLITEAGVPQELAESIAAEAEKRLLGSKITYLTAPLIREFVNTILIERKLEEYRHKLTRLGMPVYDVTKLFEKVSEQKLSVETVKGAAGSSVMEEYVLLNCLPRETADAHLSGLLHVEGLDSWVLRPSEVQHDIRYLTKFGLPFVKKPKTLKEVLAALQSFSKLSSYEISNEQSFDMFNVFLAPFLETERKEDLKEVFYLFLANSRQDTHFESMNQSLSFNFEFVIPSFLKDEEAICSKGVYGDFEEEACLMLEEFLNAALEASKNKPLINPRLIFKLRPSVLKDKNFESLLLKIHELINRHCSVYFAFIKDHEKESFFSTGLKLSDEWLKNWEMDCLRTGNMGTVFINLPRIAYESHRSDERFFGTIGNLFKTIAEIFQVKLNFIEDRFNKSLLPLLSGIKGEKPYFYTKNASYAVSFLGLNEAVIAHTGSSLSTGDKSVRFAFKLIEELSENCKEASEELNMRFILAQCPGDEASSRLAELDVEKYGMDKAITEGIKSHPYYTDVPLVPLTSKIPLNERLETESKFQALIDGGSLSIITLTPAEHDSETLLKLSREICSKNMKFFTYSKDFSYCVNCDKTFPGILVKCPGCGFIDIEQWGHSSAAYKPLKIWPQAKKFAINRRVYHHPKFT